MTERKKLKTIQELKDSEYLIEGEDYGKIPGVKKPCLLQPGAQKIARYYGYTYAFEIQEAVENHQEKFYFYRVRSIIILDGVIVGDMIGSCSTHDSGKQNAPPNSIVKIAEKRAFVSAVLYVVAGSGVFSADVDDMSAEELTGSEDGIKWFPRPAKGEGNWFCGACKNKHIEVGEMVGKPEIEGKERWAAKACYEHLKDVEGASTPEEESQEEKFKKLLESYSEDNLRALAIKAAHQMGWPIEETENLQTESRENLINFIMEHRK